MTNKKWWISDIHGYAEPFKKLIQKSDINLEEDKLLIGGDLIDRGPDSGEVVKYARWLDKTFPNVRVQRGNHERMLEQYLEGELEEKSFFINGGAATLDSFEQTFKSKRERETHIRWLTSLSVSAHSDEEFMYVHAGFHPDIPLNAQPMDLFVWIREPFLEADPQKILNKSEQRKVVHGHTPMNEVIEDEARISCDLGVFRPSGKLALVNLTDKTYWAWDKASGTVAFHEIKQVRSAEKNLGDID
ncbi:metallophosphoesterase [Bacillus piscicola]|uniref:metallophosphoesterase n=1 Tax=Bacillus piscicola TaxID=1632684 RepID=UPI001F09C5EE|nr:metallophosphoesterase [Bacillus piscicola]